MYARQRRLNEKNQKHPHKKENGNQNKVGKGNTDGQIRQTHRDGSESSTLFPCLVTPYFCCASEKGRWGNTSHPGFSVVAVVAVTGDGQERDTLHTLPQKRDYYQNTSMQAGGTHTYIHQAAKPGFP